ncbi:MAG: hypothetical protein ACSLFP_12245 [Acidimicrobiales bacterium]
MWANFADQRQRRLMYAVDTIGDVGDSHQEVAVGGAGHAVVTSHTDLDADQLDRFLNRPSPSPTT